MEKFLDLSYGENPHQRAALYTEVGSRSHVLSKVAKQHGRSLSFNNVLDLDSARKILNELDGPGCVIVKHNNPCGVAEGATAQEAYEKALACDPVSAYGGVIAFNEPIDTALAELLSQNFIEVLIAPGYGDEAMEILTRKEAIRILEDTEQRSYVARLRRQAGPRRRPDPGGRPQPRRPRPRCRSRPRPSRARRSGPT